MTALFVRTGCPDPLPPTISWKVRVTVARHPNDDLAPGTLKSILEQARLKDS